MGKSMSCRRKVGEGEKERRMEVVDKYELRVSMMPK